MAAETHNSWVEYDIAIEVIGKMIAYQNRQRNDLLDTLERLGFDKDTPELLSEEKYLRHTNRMHELKAEIDLIYSGKDVSNLFVKVKTVYAPFLKAYYGLEKVELV